MKVPLASSLALGFILSFCSAELVITRPPRNVTVLQNSGLLMHCEAAGEKRPRIKWFHNGEEMSKSGPNYRIRTTGTLRFREVKVADRGEYYCQVQSGKESLSSDPAYLVVEAEVEIIKQTPESGKLILSYNSAVRLTCWAAGIPGPRMQWRKNGISIIRPEEHGVSIEEEWISPNSVLSSELYTGNLTETTSFECEAVNQNIGGDSVQSKVFSIIVRPDEDANKGERGVCVPYNGTRCASVHGNSYVFLNLSLSNPYEDQEKMAADLLNEMFSIETTQMIRERCNGHGEKLICHYVFPPCENYLIPKPTPLCRESCTAVQDLLCYIQWPVIQNSDVKAQLPTCDKTLPSKWDGTPECTDARLFERDESEVSSHCYMGRGRWYNGTMNITRSGKPCQHWSKNTPQKHKRPPEVFEELEDSYNHCRNPGGEEEAPWCYINSDVPGERWELCDVPACGEELPEQRKEEDESVSGSTILIITIVGTVVVFVISVIGIVCYHLLASKRRDVRYRNTPQDDLEIDIQKLPANMSYHVVEEPIRLNPKLQAYEYPRNDIIYIKDIGQGAFGRVFKAKAPNILKHDEETLVAVKMLKEDASDDLQADFEREASLMAEFDHPNIVKLLGICAIGKPMCLLFEYMTKGDLNDYLRMCSPEMYINLRRQHAIQLLEGESLKLDLLDQVDISRQIAAGMVYLSEKSYVHRDLATRNCLITNNLTVKISDFGLARSVHRLEYYKGSDNDAIPIRWMPLESILYNKFSVESDVWSFGVLLWEIFSYALQPYYGMTHEEVVEYLKEGKNLVCPENTPQQIYDLMSKCWSRKPSHRPKFQVLHNAIHAFHEELTKKRTIKDVTEV